MLLTFFLFILVGKLPWRPWVSCSEGSFTSFT